jgi:hypothetical protein
MRQTCNELGRAAESELHALAEGRGLLLEGDDERRRGRKRDLDEAFLDHKAPTSPTASIHGEMTDGPQQVSNIGSFRQESKASLLHLRDKITN